MYIGTCIWNTFKYIQNTARNTFEKKYFKSILNTLFEILPKTVET